MNDKTPCAWCLKEMNLKQEPGSMGYAPATRPNCWQRPRGSWPSMQSRMPSQRRTRPMSNYLTNREIALAALCGLLIAPALWVLILALQIIVEVMG